MSKIDVIVPVLGRPQRAIPIMRSIRDNSVHVGEILFVCSMSDRAQKDACTIAGSEATTLLANWEPEGGDYAKKINLGFRASEAPYVFLGADDLEFMPGWDVEALKVAERHHPGVVGTNDEANPLVKRGKHSTHSLVSRDYIDDVGGTFVDGPRIVYHEGYDHQWVDTELVMAAQQRGQWDFARRAVVRHLHPFYDKRQSMDATYSKALAHGKQDKALYEVRLKHWKQTDR